MLDKVPVEVSAALISAVIALAVSVLFRFLDWERPVWRLEVSDVAYVLGEGDSFYVEVKFRNAGNGTAYDVRMLKTVRTYQAISSSSVLAPGEELQSGVLLKLDQKPRYDKHSNPIPVCLTPEMLAGEKAYLEWTRPPLFWFRRRAGFSMKRALARQVGFASVG